ncbi:MAG: SDR family oxidoreductase, partial [Ktedonobacteraceae bacterium]|nr:SDR family oxidoreductase [Ktedonobacteraceae bacterium]
DAPTQLTYSELFVIDYALAQFFIKCGIQPAALLGEQIGAYVAACIAGIFSLEVALSLLAYQEVMEESDGAPDAKSQEYRARLATLLLNPPTIPCLSSVSGTWISDEQATSLTYWLEVLDQPARFSEGINTLLQDTDAVLLAIGALKDGQQPSERIISFLPEQTEAASATFYNTIGQLWLAGVTIAWSNIYTDEHRLRLSLPTYPFERQRYWLEAPALQQAKASAPITAAISKKPNKADWFYQPSWERVALSGQRFSAPQSWLIFLDSSGLGQQLADRLQQQGDRVVRVYAGDQFAQSDPYTFSIRPGASDDYHRLCQELAARDQVPLRILHCWSVTAQQDLQASDVHAFSVQQESGFYSLLYLAQALATQYYDKSLQLLVLSTHLQAVHDQDHLAPGKTTILGACKVIPQELLNLTCRNIDVEFPAAGNWEETIEQLIAECAHPASEAVVAYRGIERYVQTYKALSPIGNAAAPVLRQGGVYLITGGLGGIGLTLAEHLARMVQARIVLIGRTALPAREDWSDWLANHAADEATSQKILRLQAIEALGGQVQMYQTDIANQAQVQSIVQETRSTFGALHGVFHVAGITDEKAFTAIENTSREACEAHFQAKVYGTYVLAQALQNVSLDFCFLFSSLSTVLGGIGFGAYSAANIFLDAFAHTTNQLTGSKTWISVNWDTWLVKEDVQGSFGATVIAFAMTPTEGVEALSYALSSGYTHLVNSTGDLQARMRQWLRSQSPPEERGASEHASTNDAAISLTIGEDYEEKIAEIWQQALGIEQIGLYDNFFDIGGNSLVALEVITQLKKAFRMPIPAVALFEAPTVSALAKYLRPAPATVSVNKQTQELKQRRRQARSATQQADIAIIGMSGRFPGATTVEQFWQNLCEGKESITTFTDEELLAAGVDPEDLANPDYVKARPVLEQTDQFDANFFGYSPREAELTDPQHRLFLECAWEAMEYAGYNSQTYEGLIGVFGGTNLSFYLIDLLTRAPEAVKTIDGFQISIGNDKDSLTTTVSYKMNLRGPSFAVQTFCSTSLVATHLACQSLLNGECDMAMAGGASIRVPDRVGYTFIEGGQESSDGHCRAFDAHSEGSVLGDGVGVVVLKRLADALHDGDTIHAVIKGSAINNDGSLKVSYSAPSVVGQADVVTQALDISGISPESISYVETHGTATELGDPIEIASLTRAYRQHTDKIGYCAIGSVKTNVGHLDRAAGVTSLIKTVMALKHEQIPASLHYETPNPEIDFANSPFYVNTQLRPWLRTTEHPLRAGINSLGMGGTNVHVVIEQAPELVPASPSRPWQLLVLSAKTETALQQMTQNLLAYLQTHSDVEFADVAHTLQAGRWLFDHRRMLVCRDHTDAIAALQALDTRRVLTLQRNQREQAVAFLLPGVGEQTVGMTWELYQQETTFREAVDRCCAFVKKTFDLDLYTALYPTEIQNAAVSEMPPQNKRMLFERNGHANTSVSAHLKQTELVQPVLFMLEYALAQVLMQWGVRPQALLGYS